MTLMDMPAIHTAHDENTLVEIVIPVYNEEAQIEWSVTTLRAWLNDHFPYRWRITVADNASTDTTWAIAQKLTETYADVHAIHLDQKGRGRALKYVWQMSAADVVCYMDVDLSTDINALVPLVAPLVTGQSDIAIGSRLAKGAQIERQLSREVLSRGYNLMIRTAFGNPFSDAQCGFKACRTDVARRVLPFVQDTNWFFDTEMLLLARHNDLRIHEVPVRWVEDRDSRVNIRKTVMEDIRGLWRMRQAFRRGEGNISQLPAISVMSRMREAEPVA